MVEQKEKYKIMVMAILLAICCFLTYYFHVVFERGTVFTHFFYIPIILASIWWRRKGLAVAIFLAALLIFSHFFVRAEVEIIDDFIRVPLFIAVALVTVILCERFMKAQEEIKNEKNFSESIISAVPDSLLVVDKSLRIKKVNLSFYNVFGLKPEEVKRC